MKYISSIASCIFSITFILIMVASCDCAPNNITSGSKTPVLKLEEPILTLTSDSAVLMKNGLEFPQFNIVLTNTSNTTANLAYYALKIEITSSAAEPDFLYYKDAKEQLKPLLEEDMKNLQPISLFTDKTFISNLDMPINLPFTLNTYNKTGTITFTLCYQNQEVTGASINVPWEIRSATDNPNSDKKDNLATESSSPQPTKKSSNHDSASKSEINNSQSSTNSSNSTSAGKSGSNNSKSTTNSTNPNPTDKSENKNPKLAESKANPRPITEEMLKKANQKPEERALLIHVLQKLKNNEQVDVNATDLQNVTSAGTSITKPSGTALYQAVEAGSKEIVLALIERNADPNLVIDSSKWGSHATNYTPLHVAKDTEIIKILLAAGADPKKVDSTGNTPLHNAYKAIGGGSTGDKITLLIQKEPSALKMVNMEGQTPLHILAVSNAGSFTVNAIKNLGPVMVDANARNKHGDTPLHTAIKSYNGSSVTPELVKALLDLGIDRNIKNNADKTSIELVNDFISKDQFKDKMKKIKKILET